jgi:hypothetical protein
LRGQVAQVSQRLDGQIILACLFQQELPVDVVPGGVDSSRQQIAFLLSQRRRSFGLECPLGSDLVLVTLVAVISARLESVRSSAISPVVSDRSTIRNS